jgi:hypothetical protein
LTTSGYAAINSRAVVSFAVGQTIGTAQPLEEIPVSLAPHEICKRLGEAKFKEMFLALSSAAMKASLMEVGLPATRQANQTSLKKRNEEWAKRLWSTVLAGKSSCKVMMFEWLRQTKSDLLIAFLDAVGVAHQKGLTDADFMKDVPDEKLTAAAKLLLAHPTFDHREVAAYLLFLDFSNETNKFSALELERQLAG